jgi:hypothetical protein
MGQHITSTAESLYISMCTGLHGAVDLALPERSALHGSSAELVAREAGEEKCTGTCGPSLSFPTGVAIERIVRRSIKSPQPGSSHFG